MKLIKRFQSGGGLTTAQGLASVFQGVNLQQGLSGDARLGNMQVKDGMFNPAPPLYAPMIQTQQNNLLWQTNKQTTIPEENTAQPKSNTQVPIAQEGDKLQPNRFMDFIKRFFMGPPVEHKPYVQRPQPRNTYKIKEPLEPDVKSDMNTYSGGMLPGITVEAKDLSKPQRFPYGGINVISKPINGGLDTRQRVVVNPFESSDLMAKYGDGDKLPTAPKAKDRYANSQRLYSDNAFFGSNSKYQDGQTTGVVQNTPYSIIPAIITQQIIGNDTIYRETPDQKRFRLRGFPVTRTASNTDSNRQEYETMRNRFNTAWGIAKHQSGGLIERSDNTRVQKPIPGVIPVNSEVRTYDNIPVRVKKGYPRNDEIWLDNPARPMYSPWKNIKLNGIYPSAYGVELDVLPPELMQKIDDNDTTYYIQGDNREYYPVVGYQARPQFREAFKNPKARQYKPNYFNTSKKIKKVKQVIANNKK